jgi:hypothetical protein
MPPVKCEQCGREFGSEHGLKIHAGREHAGKAKAAPKPKKAAAGVTCTICGRPFKLPMHLARHMAAAHKAAKKRAPRRVVRSPMPVKPAMLAGGLDVSALSIDELLSIKAAVDGKIGELVQKLRKIKI